MPEPLRSCYYREPNGDLFTRAEAERFARESVEEFAEEAARLVDKWACSDPFEESRRRIRALAAKGCETCECPPDGRRVTVLADGRHRCYECGRIVGTGRKGA